MKSILVTGAGGSAGHNVCWSLRVSKDGRSLVLTGCDVDRTSLELNMWLDYPGWIRAREEAGGLMSCKATSQSIAEHWVKFHWDQGIKANFIAEEYLPGRDYCFMSLWNNGGLVTSMIRERLSWVGHRVVGSGGTSKLNRVVHSDTVNKKAVEAIRAVSKKPHGIFCVDLKDDAKEVPCPTEVNW